MSASLWIGVMRNNYISQGASVCLGINIVQNRNSTKQNNGNFITGDGRHNVPTTHLLNMDSDKIDTFSFDAHNINGTQL